MFKLKRGNITEKKIDNNKLWSCDVNAYISFTTGDQFLNILSIMAISSWEAFAIHTPLPAQGLSSPTQNVQHLEMLLKCETLIKIYNSLLLLLLLITKAIYNSENFIYIKLTIYQF